MMLQRAFHERQPFRNFYCADCANFFDVVDLNHAEAPDLKSRRAILAALSKLGLTQINGGSDD
jgi:hypothetical protein